jgi:murein DD-endopeptidase MepM/ murein hydrolase activator NlpD
MRASPRSAIWPQLVAISLIGLGAASCSADSGRFGEGFGSSTPAASHSDVTGSIPQTAPSSHIVSQPMPHLASADEGGTSGGGHGMGSYQPGGAEVTGSIPAAPPPPPPPTWTWEGGTPVTVGPGDTLETIAHAHGVPASAIMEANNISSPAAVYPGEHLVIPRYRSSGEPLPPQTRMASTQPAAAPAGAPKFALTAPAGTHVVAPGETLNSIARLYGKPVMVIAKANNIAPDTRVRVGDHIIIPEMREAPHPAPVASRVGAPAAQPTGSVASADSPSAARIAEPVSPPAAAADNPVKTAEPVGNLPSFRWPVRGRIIAAFGPKPNGLQNDGINLAVPEGTPIKAAEDGVVAYAGNELKGYGNLVLVRHSNGFVTAYAHASDILVKRGETVKRGEVIAHSGQTGNVTSPQLHFEIRKGATPVDPAQYLSGA